MKYQNGNTVKITKPKDANEWPSWSVLMDPYDNAIMTITDNFASSAKETAYRGDINGESCEYIFNENWLTPTITDCELARDGSLLFDWQHEEDEIKRLKAKRDELLRHVFT